MKVLNGRDSAVDLLEDEDLELRRLFTRLHATRGDSVVERAEYDDLVVRTLRHVSAREAALTEVTRVLSTEGGLRWLASRYQRTRPKQRRMFERLQRMSRGAQTADLNQRGDFDAQLHDLVQLLGTEIEWDLDEALPAIRGVLAGTGRGNEL
jgi:hypothetical protein